jgi:uncharacterized protein YlxW (UPF0749 family)
MTEGRTQDHWTGGLLTYLTVHSLDEDYAHVAETRKADGAGAARRGPGRAGTLIVLLAFGLLLAVAAVETARSAPASERAHQSLVRQVKDRQAQLSAAQHEVTALRRSISRVQSEALQDSAQGRHLASTLTTLGSAAGTQAVSGPGVRIIADNGPANRAGGGQILDTDLQILVNGLWASGAEAVAINGHRLTTLSSIRTAGEAVTVDQQSLTRPYVVTAIGDPDQLPSRFVDSAGGTWWLNLKAVYGVRFDLATKDSLTLPAASTVHLRHVRTSAQPGRGAR